jgi:hypothetical protein
MSAHLGHDEHHARIRKSQAHSELSMRHNTKPKHQTENLKPETQSPKTWSAL